MARPSKADVADLVQHLQDEYAAIGDTHPERSAQIEEQLDKLGADVPTESEE